MRLGVRVAKRADRFSMIKCAALIALESKRMSCGDSSGKSKRALHKQIVALDLG
jgi:hypothetical protein